MRDAQRERVIPAMLACMFGLVAAGLFYNQVIRYGYYSGLSRNNSIRVVPIAGPRGDIRDRNGKTLVTSRVSFDVSLLSRELRDRRGAARVMKETLGMSGEEIARSFEKADARPYSSVKIAEDVPKERAIALEEASVDIDGVAVDTSSRRDYVNGASGSHIYGYLGEVTEDELEALRDYGYRPRDLIGRGGVEKKYESYLKGVDGGTQVEVDSRGRSMRVLGLKEPKSGTDIQLTVDSSVQEASDRLLGDRRGCVIAMDPRTGEVLALASHPAFDPNIFVRPDTSRERLALLDDRIGRPMSNKAISGLYPPGSVFKVVIASAALETGRIARQTSFICSGSFKLGRTSFDCWKDTGHGAQNVVAALMNSCNVFFYNTGRALGVDTIEAYAKIFGFGHPTLIDLPDEVGGIVPGRAWKSSRFREGWFDGETINYSIGQGYLLVTPVQVLDMTAVMANGGSLVRPHVVKKIGGRDVALAKPRKTGISEGTIRIVREGLLAAVNGETGTARRAAPDGVAVAGKTGTAQTSRGRTHAWFSGFAPFDDPRICVVVMIEHGGHGGVEAAGIARGVFEEAKRLGYFNR
jgi:penicillin-binding protein 2